MSRPVFALALTAALAGCTDPFARGGAPDAADGSIPTLELAADALPDIRDFRSCELPPTTATAPEGLLSDTDADIVVRGEQKAESVGSRIAVGDLNGDSRPDLALFRRDVPAGLVWQLDVFEGPLCPELTVGEAHASAPIAAGAFPRDLAIGDLDGDAIDDVVVRASTSGYGADQVHLYHGPFGASTGLVTDVGSGDRGTLAVGDWNGDGADDLALSRYERADVRVLLSPPRGESSASNAAFSVTGEAYWDVQRVAFTRDQEGGDDLLIGTPDLSRVDRFTAGRTGGTTLYGRDWMAMVPGQGLGSNVAFGDFDGDGAADVLGGQRDGDCPGELHLDGWTWIYTAEQDEEFSSPVASITQSVDEAWTGRGIAVGDLDGDGISDVALAAPDIWSDQVFPGIVYVFYGPIEGALAANQADAIIEGTSADGSFGDVLSLADLTGDGIDDLVVGAPNSDDSIGEVRVFVGGPRATP